MVRTFPGSVRLVAVREVDFPPMCAELFPTDAFAFFSLLFLHPFCGSVLESFVEDGERANDEKRTVINNVKENISFHGHHQKMAGYKVSNIRWDGKNTDQAPVNNQLQKSVRLALLLHTIQEITE